MKKVMTIEGMTCEHCQKRVENALNEIDGVTAKVNLKKKEATITLDKAVEGSVMKNAVTEAGYTVVDISEKKGIFG